MKRNRFGIGRLARALIAFLAMIVCPIGLAGWESVPEANATLKHKSCYPSNEFVKSDGPTKGTHAGSQPFDESEYENLGVEDDLGGGRLVWWFNAKVGGANTDSSDGSISGQLNIDIIWDDTSLGTTRFRSRCVAEIETETSESLRSGIIEAEFEGDVSNFPRETRVLRPAVASISINEEDADSGNITVHVGIELGTTCFEGSDPNGDIELNLAVENIDPRGLKVTNVDAGRWSFPIGHSPGNCPGADDD